MSFLPLTLAAVLALFAALARADHTITFVNSCPFVLTPMWKSNADGASHHTGSTLSPGQTGSTTVPEFWESGRMFAQDPANTCLLPDGAGCSLVEVDFGPGAPRFWQDNLSLVSGYNIPLAVWWVGGAQSSCNVSFSCTGPGCANSQAYRTDGCSGCISQCNTDSVGMRVQFCPAGSTIPPFARAPAPAPKPAPSSAPAPKPAPSSAPKPAPAPPHTQPAPPTSAAPAGSPAAHPASAIPTANSGAAPASSPAANAGAPTPAASKSRCPNRRRKRAHDRQRARRAGARFA